MTGIGFPESTKQYSDAIQDAAATRSGADKVSALTSDAVLTIMTNKNNPAIRIMFKNVYPTSLSGLNFDTKETGADGITATTTMNYDYYTLEVLRSKV